MHPILQILPANIWSNNSFVQILSPVFLSTDYKYSHWYTQVIFVICQPITNSFNITIYNVFRCGYSVGLWSPAVGYFSLNRHDMCIYQVSFWFTWDINAYTQACVCISSTHDHLMQSVVLVYHNSETVAWSFISHHWALFIMSVNRRSFGMEMEHFI